MQIINVYITKYESGGQYWPVFHNTTIFSLILSQIIALGFFGLKLSTVASGFTIPLILLTLLFSEYCRQRFAPIFQKYPAEVYIYINLKIIHFFHNLDFASPWMIFLTSEFSFQLLIAMDREDETTGKMEELHSKLKDAYSQIPLCSQESIKVGCSPPCSDQELPSSEQLKPEKENLEADEIWAFQRSKSSHEIEVKSCPSASPSRYSPGFADIYKRT